MADGQAGQGPAPTTDLPPGEVAWYSPGHDDTRYGYVTGLTGEGSAARYEVEATDELQPVRVTVPVSEVCEGGPERPADPTGDEIAAAQSVDRGIPYANACGYVWGRQDSGDTRASSIGFATAYALRRAQGAQGGGLPCLETAYREYVATGAITTGRYPETSGEDIRVSLIVKAGDAARRTALARLNAWFTDRSLGGFGDEPCHPGALLHYAVEEGSDE